MSDVSVSVTLPGPTVTRPMTWAVIEAEVRRRRFTPSAISGSTTVVAWEKHRGDARAIYVGDDANTWPEKRKAAMGDAIERLAEIDGVSPGEMLARLTASPLCRCLAIQTEDATRHFLGCALRDAHPAPGKDGAHAAMVEAIRRQTIEAPNDDPNGGAERAIDRVLVLLDLESWPEESRDRVAVLNGVMAVLCEALADDAKALRIAADRFFGGDFRKP